MKSFLLFALALIFIIRVEASPELRSQKAPAIIENINKKVFENKWNWILHYKSLKGESCDDQNVMNDFFGLVQDYLRGNGSQPSATPARLLSKFNALQLIRDKPTEVVSNKLVISEEMLDKKYILLEGNLQFSQYFRLYKKMERIGADYLKHLGNMANIVQVIPVAVTPNMIYKQNFLNPTYGLVVAAIDDEGGFMGLAALLLDAFYFPSL